MVYSKSRKLKELNQVAQHHKEWVNVIKSFGERNFAEDLVQETYLMLYKWSSPDKYLTNGKVNKGYIWLCLRNSFLLYQREKKKAIKLDLDAIQELSTNETNIIFFEAKEKIYTFIIQEVNTWNPYDQKLYHLHVEKKIPMRKISRGADISLTSIYESLKSCKERLRVAVGEEYEDFINEEFERI